VLSDGQVKFLLNAPHATQVMLNLQTDIGPSPAAKPIDMAKDATGVWSVTIGPLKPNFYGYGFIVGGAAIPDPANRNIWSGSYSAWSFVFVPGPEADFIADSSVPHGNVATVRYFSKVTKSERQMQVYAPPGYEHSKQAYPVLYLLHGGGGNDTDWIACMRANYLLDNLIAQGEAVPMIVVMPDWNVASFGSGLPVAQDVFPQELLGSIVPFIEQNYRVAPGPKNHALAGLSLGGNHTWNTLLLHPGAFAYVGVFSSRMQPPVRNDLVQNHLGLLSNRAINKDTKLFWITMGGPDDLNRTGVAADLPATLALFDQNHIKYTYVPGPKIGAIYGHIWDTWRKDLFTFAPLLFKK